MPSDTPFKDHLDIINGTRQPRSLDEAGRKAMHDLGKHTPVSIPAAPKPSHDPYPSSVETYTHPSPKPYKHEDTRREAGTKVVLFTVGSLLICLFCYGTNHPLLGNLFGIVFLAALGLFAFAFALWIVKRFWWAFLIIGGIALYIYAK